MKNYSEIEKQLDSGDPIVKEVFLTLLSNLNEAFLKRVRGQGFNDDSNKKFFEAKYLVIEEMRKNGFLDSTEYLFDHFWQGLHWLLLTDHDITDLCSKSLFHIKS